MIMPYVGRQTVDQLLDMELRNLHGLAELEHGVLAVSLRLREVWK